MSAPYVGHGDQQYDDSNDRRGKSIFVIRKHSKLAITNVAVVTWGRGGEGRGGEGRGGGEGGRGNG